MKGIQTPPAGELTCTPLQSHMNRPDHILVVEDDLFIRRLNTRVLVGSGYEVDAAADGAAAWRALNADSFDLLITDNSMPKLTGVELLKKLRGARMALPVIMATGALPKEEFARHPWLRPAATLLKPYTGEQMLRMVKKVLSEVAGTAGASQLLSMKDKEPSQAGELASAPPQRPPSPARRILVVDEDKDLRRLYIDALAGLGYHIDAAADGAAGWAALRANRYDLLITEHEMPSLTGVELVTMLRAARMALPVVMAARRLPTHELSRNPSLQLGATLSKPFAVDTLLDTVDFFLRTSDGAFGQMAPLPIWGSQPVADGLSQCPIGGK
jgi:DNA-binding response OmpR family regulator